MNHWLALSAACLIVALLALWWARRGQARSGLPRGRLVYTDVGAWQRVGQPFFSREHLLTGKPDYLVATERGVVPVEVKSGRSPAQPYPSHVMQLAAYCLLVETAFGDRPAYGVIKYADRAFEVDYTEELEQELLTTLNRMRSALATGRAERNHDERARCRACGHRQHCDQALE